LAPSDFDQGSSQGSGGSFQTSLRPAIRPAIRPAEDSLPWNVPLREALPILSTTATQTASLHPSRLELGRGSACSLTRHAPIRRALAHRRDHNYDIPCRFLLRLRPAQPYDLWYQSAFARTIAPSLDRPVCSIASTSLSGTPSLVAPSTDCANFLRLRLSLIH
jgi:hypothetical protein